MPHRVDHFVHLFKRRDFRFHFGSEIMGFVGCDRYGCDAKQRNQYNQNQFRFHTFLQSYSVQQKTTDSFDRIGRFGFVSYSQNGKDNIRCDEED